MLLTPEGNVLFVPVRQNYLLFIVNKFATFCVTFLTEGKRKKKKKQNEWSLVCGSSVRILRLFLFWQLAERTMRSLAVYLKRVSLWALTHEAEYQLWLNAWMDRLWLIGCHVSADAVSGYLYSATCCSAKCTVKHLQLNKTPDH